MKKLFLILICLVTAATATAQQHTVSLTGGYLCSMSPKWRYMQAPCWGVDAAVSWSGDGSSYWQQWWRRPELGVRANYTHIIDGIAGQRLAALGYLQSPIWRSQKLDLSRCSPTPSQHYLFWELGAGLALFSNPYERSLDESNDFIGSYINCCLHLGMGYRLTMKDQSAWQLTAKIVHNSNGQLTPHNKGLNFVQGELGYRLAPRTAEEGRMASFSPDSLADSWHPTLFVAYAPSIVMSRHSETPRQYYYAHTAQIGAQLHANECLSFGLTADLMYNYSHRDLRRRYHVTYPHKFYTGVSAFVEPRWGPVSLRAGIGCYLFDIKKHCVDELIDTQYYERFGLFYHFGHEGRYAVGAAMKIHQARIDYIEWTLSASLF